MKKTLLFVMALAGAITLSAKTIYLNTGGTSLWNQGSAVFFVHTWSTPEDNSDVMMQHVSCDIYTATISDSHSNLLFVRMPANSTNVDWNTNWNQTYDLQLEGNNDMYTITDWVNDTKYSTGAWSKYDSTQQGEDNNDQGNNQGESNSGDKDYFLKGFRNGSNITTPTADEQFENGILTYTFKGKAPDTKGYFFILVCDKGQVIGKQYMASAYTDGGTSVQLIPDGVQTWGIQEGTVTFYLYKDEGDSYTLSIEPIEGRQTVDAEGTDLIEIDSAKRDGIRRNLLGMHVDDNYHGIVILNGKKYIQ